MMRNRAILNTMILAATLACLGLSAPAQNSTPPPDAPAPNAPAPNSPAPKDASKTDASKTPPDAPKKTDKKPSTADDNPFPEEVSKQAAAAAKANATAPAPTHANEPNGSSSLDGLDKLGLDDPTRKELKVESPDGSPDIYDPKRATEDVRVGKFYLQTGDLKGAYDRFKDATGYDHENIEAVFWLAEAARKMHHPDEALQNYTLYLDAVPDGPNAKAARKAMSELASSSKP
jgi:TolA-binding protein